MIGSLSIYHKVSSKRNRSSCRAIDTIMAPTTNGFGSSRVQIHLDCLIEMSYINITNNCICICIIKVIWNVTSSWCTNAITLFLYIVQTSCFLNGLESGSKTKLTRFLLLHGKYKISTRGAISTQVGNVLVKKKATKRKKGLVYRSIYHKRKELI